jgi:hypothetical protein
VRFRNGGARFVFQVYELGYELEGFLRTFFGAFTATVAFVGVYGDEVFA